MVAGAGCHIYYPLSYIGVTSEVRATRNNKSFTEDESNNYLQQNKCMWEGQEIPFLI